MKVGLIVIIIVGIGILAIASVLLILSQESDVAEVEDTLDREIQPIEIPEVQEKYDRIQNITNDEILNFTKDSYKPLPREWQTSGPFQIDRSEYAIGEKIFIRSGGLQYEEKGQIAVMRPLNATHYSVYITIPFDGADKGGFNYYVEPSISKARGICSVDDITGEWVIIFRGTNYPNLNFEVTDKRGFVGGTSVETVC